MKKERKGVILVIFIAAILVLSMFLVSASWFSDFVKKITGFSIEAGVCECTSCQDCTAKLNDPACREIRLTQNILNFSGTCIKYPTGFSNKIFNCRNNLISGKKNGDGIILKTTPTLKNDNNTIKNCKITKFDRGIYIIAAKNNIIENNEFYANGKGILFDTSSNNNQIIRNRIYSNTLSGIDFSGGWTEGNIISFNTIFDNAGIGIYLRYTKNSIMSYNTIYNNREYGLYFSEYVTNNIFSNFNVYNNTRIGIWARSDSEHKGNKNNTFTNIRSCYNKGYSSYGKDIHNGDNSNIFSITSCNNSKGVNSSNGINNCDYNCINNDVCGDNLDNDMDFQTDCQDFADCSNPCSGNCVVSSCNPVTYDWECTANQSSCSECNECQGIGNAFNCNPLTTDNFLTCNQPCTSCVQGQCELRAKCDNAECSLLGADNACNGRDGTCINKASLCLDGVCDIACGENSDVCLADCPRCRSNANCNQLNREEITYSCNNNNNNIEKITTHHEGICAGGVCADNITLIETDVLWENGDSQYCTEKFRKCGIKCDYEEFDCDYDDECGIDSSNNQLACKGPTGGPLDGCCRDNQVWNSNDKKCYIENYSYSCYQGDSYWYDEGGNRQDKADDCDSNEICQEQSGNCMPVTCNYDSQCEDNLACTNDICLNPGEDSECLNQIKTGNCLINGECQNNGDQNPADLVCEKCNSSNNQTAWSLIPQQDICEGRCGSLCSYDCGSTQCDDSNACSDNTCINNFCQYPIIPQETICLGKACGTFCEFPCGAGCDATAGLVCQGSVGQCIPQGECTDTCESLNYNCGDNIICGSSVNCGPCEGNCINGVCMDIEDDLAIDSESGTLNVSWMNPAGNEIAIGKTSQVVNTKKFKIGKTKQGKIKVKFVTAKGNILLNKINFSNDSLLELKFFDTYTGFKPAGKNIISLIAVNNQGLNFSEANITLKGLVNENGSICKCGIFDLTNVNCTGSWVCSNASAYSGFGHNTTSYWFTASSFSAYAGAACQENWNCTSWSECVNDTQTRTCTDLNSCGTITNKPAETQTCSSCQDECTLNATRCVNSTKQICEEYDTDPCTEWGGNINCEYGCSNGACLLCANTCNSLGKQCGQWTICNNQTDCGPCTTVANQTCNSTGQCENCTFTTCAGAGYECGNWTICGNLLPCGTCNATAGKTCNAGKCVNATCTPNWGCSGWGSCTNSRERRSCTDTNNCNTTEGKPSTTRSCTTASTTNISTTTTTRCGDGTCNADEDYTTCPADCQCVEDWDCEDWSESECIDGEKTRTCDDLNSCGTTIYKPAETQTCKKEGTSALTWIIIIALIAAAIVVVIVLIVVISRKRLEEKTSSTMKIPSRF